MNKAFCWGLGALMVGLTGCWDASSNSDQLGGVIVTTNTSPSARAYLFNSHNSAQAIDSAAIVNGTFHFSRALTDSFVVWVRLDSSHGAWARGIGNVPIQLQSQNYRWLYLNASAFHSALSALHGYAGQVNNNNGLYQIPYLPGSSQNWVDSSQNSQVLISPNPKLDTLTVQINNQGVLTAQTFPLDSNPDGNSAGQFVDSRDQQIYPLVQISSQVWMAQNLRYLPPASMGTTYCPNGDTNQCRIMGRLYTWSSALQVCPLGFHLPDTSEMTFLVKTAGGPLSAGMALKSTSWDTVSTNTWNFSLLGAGYMIAGAMGNFKVDVALWAKDSVFGTSESYLLYFHADSSFARSTYGTRTSGYSVRCLKN